MRGTVWGVIGKRLVRWISTASLTQSIYAISNVIFLQLDPMSINDTSGNQYWNGVTLLHEGITRELHPRVICNVVSCHTDRPPSRMAKMGCSNSPIPERNPLSASV